jgi:hypothetical protein
MITRHLGQTEYVVEFAISQQLFIKGDQRLKRSSNMVHPQVLAQLDLFPSNPSNRQSLRMLKAGTKGLARCAFRKVTAAAAHVYRGGRGEQG